MDLLRVHANKISGPKKCGGGKNWKVGREIDQMAQFWLHFNTNDLAKARKE